MGLLKMYWPVIFTTFRRRFFYVTEVFTCIIQLESKFHQAVSLKITADKYNWVESNAEFVPFILNEEHGSCNNKWRRAAVAKTQVHSWCSVAWKPAHRSAWAFQTAALYQIHTTNNNLKEKHSGDVKEISPERRLNKNSAYLFKTNC